MGLIYKDITVIQETSWGASLAGDPNRLHIRNISLNEENEKLLVEETSGTPKGRGRMVSVKNNYTGDITGFLTPRNAHHILGWVNGSTGSVGSSVGASGTLFNYYQNSNGVMTSKAINIDRVDSQERYNGVRAKSLEITSSDSLTEFTLGVIAKQRGLGASIPETDIGETVKPFTFADWTVSINAGNTIGTAPITQSVKQWNLSYDNQLETSFLSGSADPARSDPKIPTIKGSFSIFHSGTSWTDANYGASEFYMRFQGVMPSDRGLIAGVTPYMLRIDVPRVQLTKSVRNYANGELSIEEFSFDGIYDPGLSSLWFAQLTAGISVS
jgi:hypothetical protein